MRNQIFISYSHKDRNWLDKLQLNLRPFLRGGSVVAWDDTVIRAGANWREEISNALASAKIALLLVSSDFLASDFIYQEELPYLLEAAKANEIRVIPVAVRPSAWKTASFNWVQWANDPERPLSGFEGKNREEELVKVCELIASFFPESALPVETTTHTTAPDLVETVSQSAEAGLRVLVEMMRNPVVRDKVATFEAVFSDSSLQIELLGYYKDLHDILHTLQFNCYNYLIGMVRAAKRDPTDLSIWDNVINYELELREKVVRKLKSIQQANDLTHGKQDWIQQLIQDLEVLFGAIDENDGAKVETAIKPIRRVLAQKPVPINASLAAAAEALRRSPLVEALTDVRECLNGAKVNPTAVKKFGDGVNALDGLKQSLGALIESHNQWQEIDVILRLVEGNMATDNSELEGFWPELHPKVASQCEGFEENWAKLLKREMTKLDLALSEADAGKVRQYFQSFRTRASYRFYEVDLALKELCEQLRKVGEPLTNVWEMIR